MVAHAVDAAIVADSSQSAAVLMGWAVAAAPTGDSSIASNLGVATDIAAALSADSSVAAATSVARPIAADMTADSSVAPGATALYAVDAAPTADSGVVANAALFDDTVICFCDADSAMTADALVTKLCFSNIVGGAQLAVDPAGVILIRAAHSAGIPETAKPPTIPTIRITPPAPPAPSFSVSANPRRRREDR